MPDSVRHLQSADDMMRRYHADIERLVFGDEIICHEAGGDETHCPMGPRCAFRCNGECGLDKLSGVVGDARTH